MSQELIGHMLGQIDGDGEADPLTAGVNGSVDADRLAMDVAERSARVTKVDRGISLDEVLIGRCASEDVEIGAPLSADDADRDRAAKLTERIADRDRPIT